MHAAPPSALPGCRGRATGLDPLFEPPTRGEIGTTHRPISRHPFRHLDGHRFKDSSHPHTPRTLCSVSMRCGSSLTGKSATIFPWSIR
ncbi:hypothetical protein FHP24_22030 [Aliirhizobium smilacinae]|uniref:Uncharacterized protein n=1 Tax=Aliirhizobium smilacinae TaxID=1395944 RepID=A0A5C4XD30_9HYPH|nr:hypothetical protein FHP24_22030 [Rhizobium smilacinae]